MTWPAWGYAVLAFVGIGMIVLLVRGGTDLLELFGPGAWAGPESEPDLLDSVIKGVERL